MIATLAIVRVSARNVLGLRRLLGFGILAVFPAGIFLLVSRTATEIDKAESFTVMTMGIFLAVVVPIVSIVMSASVLGSERRGNTLSFLMLRPLSRFGIAGAKLASAIVASFAITGVGAAVLGLMGDLTLSGFGFLIALVVTTLIGTVGYSAVFMPLGYLTERSTLIGFVYIFIWEVAIAGTVPGLRGTSLYRASASAFAELGRDRLSQDFVEATVGQLSPDAGGAAIKAAILAATLAAISILFTGWLLRTRDLT